MASASATATANTGILRCAQDDHENGQRQPQIPFGDDKRTSNNCKSNNSSKGRCSGKNKSNGKGNGKNKGNAKCGDYSLRSDNGREGLGVFTG